MYVFEGLYFGHVGPSNSHRRTRVPLGVCPQRGHSERVDEELLSHYFKVPLIYSSIHHMPRIRISCPYPPLLLSTTLIR